MQTDPRRVVLRPLARGESAVVEAVFAGLSSHSRYLRFHGPRPRLTAAMRDDLSTVDGSNRVAVVAEVRTDDACVPIGVGHLIATGDHTAEIAFAVVDRWHGVGVGRRLLTALLHRAADLGHRRLTAYVLAENRAALGLLRAVLPDVRIGRDDMTLVLTATLPAAASGPAPARLAAGD